jgi:23S rRNA (cytosine1962-C5)-methyltransferase
MGEPNAMGADRAAPRTGAPALGEPQVVLKAGRDGPVTGGHPWVFSGAVAAVEGDPEPGAIVRVVAADRRFLGRGAYAPRGAITVRLLSRRDEPIDAGLVRRRVAAAVELREAVVPPGTTAYRLVNGEGDGLPGVVADRYGEFVVCQYLTAGGERLAALVDGALAALLAPRGIYERSEGSVRRDDGLTDRCGGRAGEAPPEAVAIVEHGAHFLVDVRGGQKTGFFLDAFGYTGGFAVTAKLGGATHVVSVETSAPALALARRNWEANALPAGDAIFTARDVFEHLREDRSRYDLVVLDPPPFVRRRRDLESGLRGYREVNRQAFLHLAPGGWLLTCSCSHHLTAEAFRAAVTTAAAEARRTVQIVRRLGPGPDHPVALAHTEGDYLTGLLVRALD